MVEHEGIAPSTSVWKTVMYLPTPMLAEMESRVGVAPTWIALQAIASTARPTGQLAGMTGLEPASPALARAGVLSLLNYIRKINGQEAGIRTRTVCFTGRDADWLHHNPEIE